MKKINITWADILLGIYERVSFLGCVFLAFAILTFCFLGVSENRELNEYRKNGAEVTASVYKVDRVQDGDDTDYYVHFKYKYGGKIYTWCEDGSDCREGDVITAYIDPKNPEELYIYEGGFFVSFVLLAISAFFFWMKNGYPRYGYSLFIGCEGILMIIVGAIYGLDTWIGWGIFFVLVALIVVAIGMILKKRAQRMQEIK